VKISRGLTQIYTGDGKGKTSAALGLALRATGQNLRVIFIQFVKGSVSGEHKFAAKHRAFKIVRLNNDNCFNETKEELTRLAKETLEISSQALTEGKYDVVILDEIFMAYNMGLIKLKEIQQLIESKLDAVELVMTGRDAPRSLRERADLVTEMTLIKHPYSKGIEARPGIEF
jgi:cob(I)alamin adenosyltransferase